MNAFDDIPLLRETVPATDLLICDAEPIHTPGAIQRFGFLAAFDPQGRIFRISANLPEFLPLTPAAVLGQPLETLLGNEAAARARALLGAGHDAHGSHDLPVFDAWLPGGNSAFTLTLTPFDHGMLLECEPQTLDVSDYTRALREVSKSCEWLRETQGVAQLLQTAAEIIRDVCGYHRTMVYRFDSEMNGEIVVEAVNGVEPRWRGQHFPHTDIPAQARALYLNNRIRMIVDIDYEPAPLLGLAGDVASPLDLGQVMLRAISPMHVEYLSNMGVRATLTMSLVLHGRLWGMIVCHHNETFHAGAPMRLTCDLIAQVVSLQLEHLLAAEHSHAYRRLKQTVDTLMVAVRQAENHPDPLLPDADALLHEWEADALELMVNGERQRFGRSAPEPLWLALGQAFASQASPAATAIDRLTALLPEFDGEFDWVAGALWVPLSETRDGHLLWLRREQLQKIPWAGHHEKLLATSPDGQPSRLTPRASFETWIEEVRGRCLSWSAAQIEAADYLAQSLRNNQEQRIREQSRQLMAASAAKSQFLAQMSHEIRTPMNAILGFAKLLEDEALSEDQQQMVRRINAAGRSLLSIINDILDFSKIEAGQLSIEQSPFKLAELLGHISGLMGAVAQAKGLTLRLQDDTPLAGRIRGDALRIEQVLINLVGNALKFTEQGGVILRVAPVTVTETTARLRFEIEDTGIGLSPDALERLFVPFTQAESGIARRFGGTGLGLSISKRLVELMGGHIGVESTFGVGSTFWFELPLGRLADAEQSATPAAQVKGPRLQGLRLLVVDDSPINLKLAERVLQREGDEVTLMSDGQQALDGLRAHPAGFDLVLMDIHMPVMDGLTATRAIREELGLDTLPVIALTAGVMADEKQNALDAGINDFLPKPMDMDLMVGMIRTYCPPSG
jgi:light-regulated signal transduction histidine kinase (bacteriophytochrome)/CheY-like chemotaxis protein